jgi:hypothetical protein
MKPGRYWPMAALGCLMALMVVGAVVVFVILR